MTMNVLYLQKYYSKNANPLKGRKLYERFRQDSVNCRLGYMVHPAVEGVEPQYHSDVVTDEELRGLAPDLIFVEGGLIAEPDWRIPEQVLEREITRGAVVVISDVDWNVLNQKREPYERVLKLCRATVAYHGTEPVELYDPVRHYEGERQIVCHPEDMAYEPWLAPIYESLPRFVVGIPAPMRAWHELVATCNRSTTRAAQYLGGMRFGDPESGAFAAAHRIGLGYVVIITGSVSGDVWIESFPGNLEWLTRLSSHLIDRVRIDRRINTETHQVFVSHRHVDHAFAESFRHELRRRGFGTWLDSRNLIVGDDLTPEISRAIEESSHLALIWSHHCLGAKWIELELDQAMKCGKRIFVIRLDETSVPTVASDKLRIEAQSITPIEAARLVTLAIEHEEAAKKRTATISGVTS